MKTIKIFFAAALFLNTVNLFAQSGTMGTSDARSSGMGKTFTASSFGLYALGHNPANLYKEYSKNVELILPVPIPNISLQVGTNFMTLDEYNYFFGSSSIDADGKKVGRYLTDADKDRLKKLFADGGTVSSNASLQWLGLSIKPSESFGTIAFSISDVISSSITFPKGIIDLGMDGNLPNQVYNFNDTQFKAWWLRKYSFSYARSLNIFPFFKSLSVGVTFSSVQGYFYAGLDHVNTQLTTGDGNIITGKGDFLAHFAASQDFNVKYSFDEASKKSDFKYSPFPKSAGSGLGVDIGLNARVNDYVSVAFAVTDIGTVKWTEKVAEYSSNKAIYLDDLTSQSQRDSLVNALTGKDNGKYVKEISTELATALHLGVAVRLSKVLLAADYNQGFNEQPGNTKKSRFSFGADWSLGVLALRTGLSFGGLDKFNWGAGFGLDFGILEMNFATPDLQYAFSPNTAKRVTVAIDSRWKF